MTMQPLLLKLSTFKMSLEKVSHTKGVGHHLSPFKLKKGDADLN